MKNYFTKSIDNFVVMVKPNHYPSIKGLFKDEERILKVILIGSGKIQKQEEKVIVSERIEDSIAIFKEVTENASQEKDQCLQIL